jgi:hypothetical protein
MVISTGVAKSESRKLSFAVDAELGLIDGVLVATHYK